MVISLFYSFQYLVEKLAHTEPSPLKILSVRPCGSLQFSRPLALLPSTNFVYARTRLVTATVKSTSKKMQTSTLILQAISTMACSNHIFLKIQL
jgi:hypothetical protein